MKPRMLDLFCCAGGATRGYQLAGFHVTGVDIKPQPRYVGDAFVQGDGLAYLAKHGHLFDALHASPPCQPYSEATPMAYRNSHPDLIERVRDLLQATGKPYVIENVEGARGRLRNPVMLCGSMFGLPIWRHRYFETWPALFMSPATCIHIKQPITVHGRKTWIPVRCTGGKRTGVRPRQSVEVVRWAMEIPWMTQAELTQAIPPAYCAWIGDHLMAHILSTAPFRPRPSPALG